MREAIARIERFERLREALSKREEDLIRRSLDNIEELERLKDEERAARGSSEVPFDPITTLEQFSSETPSNQWDLLLSLVPSIVTSEEVLYN